MKPPDISNEVRASIAVALAKARRRRHPDVVTLSIPPNYPVTIAFEQKEFGLARHLTIPWPGRRTSAVAKAVVAIAEAFGFKPSNVLSQWLDDDGYHVLGTDHDFHG